MLKAKKLCLSQYKYVEWVLERFNIKDAKLASTPLASHFKLSKSSCPSSKEEREEVEAGPYSSVLESLMSAMDAAMISKLKKELSKISMLNGCSKRFNAKDAKPASTLLASHFKLSKSSCPSSKEEREEVEAGPYSSVLESLMSSMVCTRLVIAQAVGIVSILSRFLSNPWKEYLEGVKWILRYLKGTSKLCLSFGGELN
ncbi:hypothetical protein Acr_00g0034790 [Actinidia rufa]|uniref:Uncharacterized protein n=1 Tax=Actinidia rufa TaxID=165716 RepID=A0A7J0DG37_9ERIC|nr:hypothetical protein Acr_00g0034790 [Actinidia rufa]